MHLFENVKHKVFLKKKKFLKKRCQIQTEEIYGNYFCVNDGWIMLARLTHDSIWREAIPLSPYKPQMCLEGELYFPTKILSLGYTSYIRGE